MIESPESRCRLNVECWLRETGFPCAAVILEGDLKPQADRCFVVWSQFLEDRFDLWMDHWDFFIHSKDHQPLGYPTSQRGWRERRWRWAAQPIKHKDATGYRFFELDFDKNNPNWGLFPGLWHIVWDYCYQKIMGRKTDPWKVAKARGWLTSTERESNAETA